MAKNIYLFVVGMLSIIGLFFIVFNIELTNLILAFSAWNAIGIYLFWNDMGKKVWV